MNDLDRLFDAACAQVQAEFEMDGDVQTCTWLAPLGPDDTVVPFVIPDMPPPAHRQQVWQMLTIACIAFDAEALVHMAEVWRSENLQGPPEESADRVEAVMVSLIWRADTGVMQRMRMWPILRAADGSGTLGEVETLDPCPARGNVADCIPVTRPPRHQRRQAYAAIRKLIDLNALREVKLEKETVH